MDTPTDPRLCYVPPRVGVAWPAPAAPVEAEAPAPVLTPQPEVN